VSGFSFLCTFVNGKLRLFDRASFDRGVAQFCDGEEIEGYFESVGERYTRAQEKFFHGPVLAAFMSTGLGKQAAKDMLALMFIPREIRMLDGSIVRVPGHTSSLKKDEYTAFINECVQLAAENGLYIKDGDEWRREHDPTYQERTYGKTTRTAHAD
jgi:hypothetical protein